MLQPVHVPLTGGISSSIKSPLLKVPILRQPLVPLVKESLQTHRGTFADFLLLQRHSLLQKLTILTNTSQGCPAVAVTSHHFIYTYAQYVVRSETLRAVFSTAPRIQAATD